MSNFCADIGYLSVNHYGEELCGDHVDVVPGDESSTVVVLADGLGSGVKASILSTLTSKIISTMLAAGLSLEDCVSTIAATLPVDAQRGVAYSTFTILHIRNNVTADLIQYDNPLAILIRDGVNCDYPRTEARVEGKKIYRSSLRLQENDTFILMSDGCPHAGIGVAYNFGWRREEIIDFMEPLATVGYTAKTLATLLVNECFQLYGGQPGDDATACVVKIRKRTPMNMLFGPPANRDDGPRMMSLFFSKEGKHIICGGTTASIAAKYLGKRLDTTLNYVSRDVPPISKIEGVDLVTEGVITVNKVLEYAKDYLADNTSYEKWNFQADAASQIARLLFEEATDINFYVGRAINPAHQDPKLPINFSIKMNLVKELSACLEQMGKRIKVSYF
ncbi:MAG: SpoIIE family protein phosphatase [Oscillospiraceae bacterium]|nr:SpoIIE family protein phosphatase [Oscillospiraceae bacterium]MBR4195064.1 SpoIIE family protein phosphatase [Oscillospiraceae bacterium]MBR4657174.1 SpoIIE family protein phosphatase [Oscillospiraceae bacterium]MBR7009487.1 SpoIIE family protein phosphatase [Oscillospiraceae bacterium]